MALRRECGRASAALRVFRGRKNRGGRIALRGRGFRLQPRHRWTWFWVLIFPWLAWIFPILPARARSSLLVPTMELARVRACTGVSCRGGRLASSFRVCGGPAELLLRPTQNQRANRFAP